MVVDLNITIIGSPEVVEAAALFINRNKRDGFLADTFLRGKEEFLSCTIVKQELMHLDRVILEAFAALFPSLIWEFSFPLGNVIVEAGEVWCNYSEVHLSDAIHNTLVECQPAYMTLADVKARLDQAHETCLPYYEQTWPIADATFFVSVQIASAIAGGNKECNIVEGLKEQVQGAIRSKGHIKAALALECILHLIEAVSIVPAMQEVAS
jgi:hypothetical protein